MGKVEYCSSSQSAGEQWLYVSCFNGQARKKHTYPVKDTCRLLASLLGPWTHLLGVYSKDNLAPIRLDHVNVVLHMGVLGGELVDVGLQHRGRDIFAVVVLDQGAGKAKVSLADQKYGVLRGERDRGSLMLLLLVVRIWGCCTGGGFLGSIVWLSRFAALAVGGFGDLLGATARGLGLVLLLLDFPSFGHFEWWILAKDSAGSCCACDSGRSETVQDGVKHQMIALQAQFTIKIDGRVFWNHWQSACDSVINRPLMLK